MHEHWIDDLARHLAGGRSRRSLLRSLVGGASAIALGSRGSYSGVAAQDSCAPWETPCASGFGGDQCVDVTDDEENCGQCGNVCPVGARCQNAECVCGAGLNDGREVLCPGGLFGGDSICVDVGTDPDNCGQCGSVCPSGAKCEGGACVCGSINDQPGAEWQICPGGLLESDVGCADIQHDPNHCGGCGVACGDGTPCDEGVCRDSTTPATSTGSTGSAGNIPFQVDTVTDATLTETAFAAYLPRSLSGHVLATDLTAEEAAEPYYDGVLDSRNFYYYDPKVAVPEITAFANVSMLPSGRSVLDLLSDDRDACLDTIDCTIDDEELSPTARIVFELQRFQVDGLDDRVHFLAWGERLGRTVYTLEGLSASQLEELATAFVSNARAARE